MFHIALAENQSKQLWKLLLQLSWHCPHGSRHIKQHRNSSRCRVLIVIPALPQDDTFGIKGVVCLPRRSWRRGCCGVRVIKCSTTRYPFGCRACVTNCTPTTASHFISLSCWLVWNCKRSKLSWPIQTL